VYSSSGLSPHPCEFLAYFVSTSRDFHSSSATMWGIHCVNLLFFFSMLLSLILTLIPRDFVFSRGNKFISVLVLLIIR